VNKPLLDREHLESFADDYLEALSKRDPSRLATSPGARYTENCQTLAIGKGLWATATPGISYRNYIADTDSAQIGLFAVVRENDSPAVLAARLRVQDEKVSEIEALVARWSNPLWEPETLKTPHPAFMQALPDSGRISRAQLVKVADSYFDAIEQDNGDIVPVHPDCYRLENGVRTTSNPDRPRIGRLDVKAGLSSGFYSYITEIRDRRYPVVDKERGNVLSIVFFEHPGTVRSVEVEGFGRMDLAPFTQKPSSAMIAELFKVQGGQIRMIEAVLEFLPYGTRPGWD
jgi:hypothetical protein